jgi:hypothetical protein
MRVNIIEVMQTYIIECRTREESGGCSGLERERPEDRRVVCEEERFAPHLFGGPQDIEKEEERSHIENKEGSGDSKSQTPIDREGVAIERIERTAKDLRMAHKKGQGWIWMRFVSVLKMIME